MKALVLPTSRLMTTEEAANYLNVGVEFLKRCRYGKAKGVIGPVYVKLGTQARYDRRDLDRWVAYYRTNQVRVQPGQGYNYG